MTGYKQLTVTFYLQKTKKENKEDKLSTGNPAPAN